MKLRNKALLALGLSWCIFIGVTYSSFYLYLLHNFLALEHSRTENDLSRIEDALTQNTISLASFTTDWSHWNDIYNFVTGTDSQFINNNMTLLAFQNSNICMMSIWKNDGTTLYGQVVVDEGKAFKPLPSYFDPYISPHSFLTSWNNLNQTFHGFIHVNKQIMMVAAGAITDGSKIHPAVGTLITGRFFSHKILQSIVAATKVDLQLIVLEPDTLSPEIKHALIKASNKPDGHYIKAINEKTLFTYIVVKDINGTPIGILKGVIPRNSYMAGLQAIHYYLATYLITGFLFSLLMLTLLRSLIIKRLEKLDEELTIISDKHTVTERVTDSGNDELSSVAAEINIMLDIIQASQEQLEHRVVKRTEELHKTNKKLQEEITERKSIEQELMVNKEHLLRLAHYDNLTGLPNRVFFNEILNKALAHAARQNKIMAVLFIDLDRFKNINDAMGHSTGDLVLKEIAKRLESILRAGDVLARLSGDEFIALLNDIPQAKFASNIADKLLQVCAIPVKIDSHEFFTTASVGICIFPNDGKSLEDLQKNADMAMYKAKHAGGNNFQYFTKEMNAEAHEHIQLETHLRKGIVDQEFVLLYQPKLDLSSGKVTGVEALIRWDSAELGMISPTKFIPLAEETGLILQIGEWALREACKTGKRWQDEGFEPISVAVNLSPKQFRHKDIAKLVALVLKETGLPPEFLNLEITETAVMDNVETAIQRLTEIKKMGVKISVDDFGTGYTSISYLKRFPIDVLKVDQSFIKGIPKSTDDAAIVNAVIAMAHNLSMSVVAEGVETEEQMQYLAEHGCDVIQGYFISSPEPANKVVLQFIRKS
ncbi:MAG: EAL domain-containing protein [Pseudomonadota bacterium]